ncbi:hypothetical protein J6590_022478 [Homalodisca vitripennis]|nr:hypothetical protein J6590_022478 [Homalodisca vitripennis]
MVTKADLPRSASTHTYNTRRGSDFICQHNTLPIQCARKPSYISRKLHDGLPQLLKTLKGKQLKTQLYKVADGQTSLLLEGIPRIRTTSITFRIRRGWRYRDSPGAADFEIRLCKWSTGSFLSLDAAFVPKCTCARLKLV